MPGVTPMGSCMPKSPHAIEDAERLSSLDRFQRDVSGTELDNSYSPYTINKSRAHTYQMIFMIIGAILILLGCTVFMRSSNAIFELHIGYCWLIKLLIGSFSLGLGSLALTIGLQIRNEHEVARTIESDSRRKLMRLYTCKLNGAGGLRFNLWAANPERARPFKQAYLEALETLRDQCDQCRLLIKQIANAPFLPSEEREKLFNRALAQFRRQQEETVRQFSFLELPTTTTQAPVSSMTLPVSA